MTRSMEPRALRDAFGAFLTGVTIVTTTDSTGKPIGFTANSFSSVSLHPPLLSVCLAKTSGSYAVFAGTRQFAVNILAEGQKALSNTFARSAVDRFAAVDWQPGIHGVPLLADVAAWFDCRMFQQVDAGDHLMLLGEVQDFADSGRAALGYARGAYFTPSHTEGRLLASATATTPTHIALVIEHQGHILLLPDAQGAWVLPRWPKPSPSTGVSLAVHFSRLTGMHLHMGLLYSMYDDTQTGVQHVVYRAAASTRAKGQGTWFDLACLPLVHVADTAIRELLKRYVQESQLGNFSIYVGNQHHGDIHAVHPHVIREHP